MSGKKGVHLLDYLKDNPLITTFLECEWELKVHYITNILKRFPHTMPHAKTTFW